MQWIHPDFLESPEAYARAQQFWVSLWQEIAADEHWELFWMTNPIQDGNPIFTAVCPSLARGVRIIQESPGEPDNVDLTWWLDWFGSPDETDSVRELVIACYPSQENLPTIKSLLREWVAGNEPPPSSPATSPATPPSVTD